VHVAASAQTITQTIANVTDADSIIVPANAARKSLLLVNINTAGVALGFGAPAAIGAGYPLSEAPGPGAGGGGGLSFSNDAITLGAIHGICATGLTSTVCVLEGT
jgi:uncharacterized spore protein YtfJ